MSSSQVEKSGKGSEKEKEALMIINVKTGKPRRSNNVACDETFYRLLVQMLEKDPKKRPNCSDIEYAFDRNYWPSEPVPVSVVAYVTSRPMSTSSARIKIEKLCDGEYQQRQIPNFDFKAPISTEKYNEICEALKLSRQEIEVFETCRVDQRKKHRELVAREKRAEAEKVDFQLRQTSLKQTIQQMEQEIEIELQVNLQEATQFQDCLSHTELVQGEQKKEIVALKKEIERLKRKISAPPVEPEKIMVPDAAPPVHTALQSQNLSEIECMEIDETIQPVLSLPDSHVQSAVLPEQPKEAVKIKKSQKKPAVSLKETNKAAKNKKIQEKAATIYKCQDCEKEYGSTTARSNHRKMAHGNVTRSVCHICQATFAYPHSLKFHLDGNLCDASKKRRGLT